MSTALPRCEVHGFAVLPPALALRTAAWQNPSVRVLVEKSSVYGHRAQESTEASLARFAEPDVELLAQPDRRIDYQFAAVCLRFMPPGQRN